MSTRGGTLVPTVYTVRITDAASDDLRRIHQHISRSSPDTAPAVIQKMLDEIFSLDVFPHRGLKKNSRKLGGVVRQIPVMRTFRALYSVDDLNRMVFIYRVQHGGRNRW